MEQQQEQKGPTNVTARFSISLEDPAEPMVVARVKADGQEAKVPYFLVLGGVVISEGLQRPEVRAVFANILQQNAQQLALSVIKEAQAANTPEGPTKEPTPPVLPPE